METKFSLPEKLPDFGAPLRSEFMLDFDKWVFANQGSYGVCPRRVVEFSNNIRNEIESNPDIFFRTRLRDMHFDTVRKAADLVGADPDNLVLCSNVTSALNDVLKSIRLKPEDQILVNNFTYNAIANAAHSAVKKYDADTLSLDIKVPIESESEIVEMYVEVVQRNRSIRVAVIDHISSQSAIRFPVAKIAEALHAMGVIVIVDGAHAPGHLPLDLEDLGRRGVDFYAGNLHKWAFVPRGRGILWVKPEHRKYVEPTVISHSYGSDEFNNMFFTQGTLDYSSLAATSAALDFYGALGGQSGIAAYVEPMLDWAADMLAESLGTSRMKVPKSMEAPFMRLVALPDLPQLRPMSLRRADLLCIEVMQEHNIVMPITCHSGHFWARLSGSVFNTREDYLRLKEALSAKVQEWTKPTMADRG